MTESGYLQLEEIHQSRRLRIQRAIRLHDHARVILKTFAGQAPEVGEMSALGREHDLLTSLDVAGVVKSLGVETLAGRPALILEDPGGAALGALTFARPMPLEPFLRMGVELAEIVGAIHARGVIHKDITPWNVLVDSKTGRPTLIDLHLATRLVSEPQEPRPPQALDGTLAYMSPEQTGRTSRHLDTRTDLYSLGATLYAALTGHPPFEFDDPLELIHSHLARMPIPPAAIVPGCPGPVSDIVMRLLAKTPEQRYQGAQGVIADLNNCLTEWRDTGTVAALVAGEADVRRRFEIPRQLYGREEEVAGLLAAFDRACAGSVELVMISGYAGIGKTSLIRELYAPVVRRRGYLTAGKFDQIVRIPYGAFIQAFRGLLQQLLSEDERPLARWRDRLASSLGAGAGVLAEVMPEIELLLGRQAAAPQAGPTEAQNRFRLALQNLVRALADEEHPLVVFLDDLQWADAATLGLLEPFLTGLGSGYLMLIGAYRDNEVDAAHPLARTMADLEAAGIPLRRLMLGPLTHGDLLQLLGDTLRGDSAAVERLAKLVEQKTVGNPFFVIQFLEALHHDGLVAFDPAGRRWRYDPEAIARAGMTDNVIDLMTRRIGRLSPKARTALTFGACIGNRFDLHTLAIVSEQQVGAAAEYLREALEEGLLLPAPGHADPPAYTFLHDRVQQAAYTSIPEERKQSVHLAVGRLLLDGWDPATAEERLFDIVHHLNIGRGSIVEEAEALQLARLDLAAARRARASTAFEAARGYLQAAIGLLPANRWETDYELLIELHLMAAECEYLAGEEPAAERLIATLLTRARTRLDKVRVHQLQIVRYEYLTRYADALAVGRNALELFGLSLPADSAGKEAALAAEMRSIELALASRSIDSLTALPTLVDSEIKALMGLLASLHTPFYLSGDKISTLLNTAMMVRLSLEHGNTQESALAYVLHAMHIGPILGEYGSAYDFGRLAIRLNDHLPDPRIRARVLMNFSWAVSIWRRPMRESFQYTREAFRLGNETGLFSDAGYALFNECYLELLSGPDLRIVAPACEMNVDYLRRVKMIRFIDGPMVIRQWAMALQGRTASPTSLDDASFDEAAFAEVHRGESLFEMFRDAAKLSLLCTFGRWREALRLAERAAEPLREYTGTIWDALRVFHQALAVTAQYAELPEAERQPADEALHAHERRMARWAENAPANFRAQHLMVCAEIARVRGRADAAAELYESAIEAASTAGCLRDLAMANELCGRFWLGRRQSRVAAAFLSESKSAYRRWGASAKVQALDAEFRDAHAESADPGLDSASVVKAASAIAGEIELARLVSTLLRIAIENAGAERAVLLLERGGEPWVQGQGTIESVDVELGEVRRLSDCDELPHRICNFVRHTMDSVVLEDARTDDRYRADPYIARRQPRSVMCTPVLNQGRLVGSLYLENNLTAGAFTPARLQIMQILASQAAISLVNAQLYEAMRQSELRYSTLAEAVPEILFTSRADGFCDYTSRRLQEYTGLSAEEALGEGWMSALHPDDRQRTRSGWLEAVRTGKPYEIEYRLRRADGAYRWFRGHAVPMRDASGQIVQWFGACADIDDLKRAEQDLRTALSVVGQLKERLEVENIYLQEQIDLEHTFEEIVGRSPPLIRVLQQVEQVAPADTTVLVTGETGTGKELVARAIHKLSPRRDRTMVTVNCGAISPGLVESELFGHERGAFTGAVARKIGRFELADGGTIFLDEIGDLTLDLQVKLLRMLQEGEIDRVGGTGPMKVNVRVIAATHKDLEEAVASGRFRADLYYRLNVFPIHIPALRERKEDIPALVRYFVQKYATKLGRRIESIPKSALEVLAGYSWPGNIRELANILERSVIVSRGTTLELGEWITQAEADQEGSPALDHALDQVTRKRIIEALDLTGWRVSGPRGAARLLGLKPTTLEARMRRLDIRRPTRQSS